VRKYGLLDVDASVERLASGAGAPTLSVCCSGNTITGGGLIESTSVPTGVSSRNVGQCRCHRHTDLVLCSRAGTFETQRDHL
jgi:hypothetical protein